MRLLIFFFILQICLIAQAGADVGYRRVQVADPFLELHTAPGRGFPVFQVVERGEWVEILKRKTDWFKVRTVRNKEGWVNRTQIENTLTEAGVKTVFQDASLDDYARHRVDIGFAWGTFAGDPVLIVRAAAALTLNLSAELSASQVSGVFSRASLYQLNLLAIPYADRRVSPFFTIGAGQYNLMPKATLVNAPGASVTAANVGIGVRIYLSRNFLVRGDFREYMVPINDNRVDRFHEWTLGLGVFF